METELEKTLLRDILAFCEKHEISESYFGMLAVGAHNLVPRLRAGHSVHLTTYQKIRAFLNSGWTRKYRKRKSPDEADAPSA